MKLRSAPFQHYLLPAFDTPDPASPSPPAPPTPPAPPAPHARQEPETFSREYVQELRAENKGTRLKAVEEQKKREEAEAAAKKAMDEATAKIAAAEAAAKELADQATKAANERVIRAELKVAAQKAGMVDLDGLKLADLSKVTLEDDGTVKGADELMAALKEAKPYLFGNATKGSSNPNPPPPPGDTQPKKAKDMTEAERAAFLADHKRKFG